VAEGKEDGELEHLIAVPNVDIFTVQRSSSLCSVVQECRVVLESFWEGEREFCGGVDGSEKHVCDCVSGFVAAVPLSMLVRKRFREGTRLTACTNPLTDEIQGIATGVPDCITTTVEGFAVETAEIKASM
jgi:hypothetical protein